jgi:hypothetical protein
MDETRTVTQTHERKVPPAPGQPYLFLTLQCDRPLQKGARFSLGGIDRVTLGRGAALQAERLEEAGATMLKITVPDARMSGTHARLHKVLGRWAIEDAGSKNGTFVDGQRVATMPLSDDAVSRCPAPIPPSSTDASCGRWRGAWRRCRRRSRWRCSGWPRSPARACRCWSGARAARARS